MEKRANCVECPRNAINTAHVARPCALGGELALDIRATHNKSVNTRANASGTSLVKDERGSHGHRMLRTSAVINTSSKNKCTKKTYLLSCAAVVVAVVTHKSPGYVTNSTRPIANSLG